MSIKEKIKKFWNETLGPDYSDEELLNKNSTDPVESVLAKSNESIENQWKKRYESPIGKNASKSKLNVQVEYTKLPDEKQQKQQEDKTKIKGKDDGREIAD